MLSQRCSMPVFSEKRRARCGCCADRSSSKRMREVGAPDSPGLPSQLQGRAVCLTASKSSSAIALRTWASVSSTGANPSACKSSNDWTTTVSKWRGASSSVRGARAPSSRRQPDQGARSQEAGRSQSGPLSPSLLGSRIETSERPGDNRDAISTSAATGGCLRRSCLGLSLCTAWLRTSSPGARQPGRRRFWSRRRHSRSR